MEITNPVIAALRSRFEESDNVWFFVNVSYRILHFNKKAAANCTLFHNKVLKTGDSILDFARDTDNKVDEAFITCLGKAALGEQVTHDQQVIYKGHSIWTRCIYIPVYTGEALEGVSIEVQDITRDKCPGGV